MISQYKPGDDSFETKVRESFDRQGIMKTVKASLSAVHPGRVEIEFPHHASLTQQHGFIHAGIVSTVLDSACGYAAFSLMPPGAAVLTIEFKINLLSPAKGDYFKAVGTVRKPGRQITVTEGEMYAYLKGEEKLVATMVGTMMSVFNRVGIEN